MKDVETPLPGLYIHIPFCATRCTYCDFVSFTDTSLIPAYIRALPREIEAYREIFPSFDTIYLGGGTPSLLAMGQVEAILHGVCRTFVIPADAEITIEVNPADWGLTELSTLRATGVNRLSMGVQSLDDGELAFLGRRHTARQAMDSVDDARSAGFENISIDLIYGLPDQPIEAWERTLVQAVRLEPEHLSCYGLEIKPGTPLGLRCGRSGCNLHTEDEERAFFVKTSEFLQGAGYTHYEISNFARGMGRASRHNRKYWDHTPYLGLGPSAHSFMMASRWWNHGSLSDYLDDLEHGRRPVAGREELTTDQLAMEALFLGLRTTQGIDLDRYHSRYGIDLIKERGPFIEELAGQGLLEIQGGFIRPTLAGMAVSDSLALL
ncbi:MAG: radical SAM family heme chaperone HemW [Desulfobacterota bacterium]|jgi:oxygen-independent coproporphyrinogen-3 oxidase|nr:radical SAM family heme chaperone HemW [Thermodesulfobacteriota bacterium]